MATCVLFLPLQMLELPHDLSQEAWNIANDSLRTTLCVRYKAEVQACGIVFLAARRLKVSEGQGRRLVALFCSMQRVLMTVLESSVWVALHLLVLSPASALSALSWLAGWPTVSCAHLAYPGLMQRRLRVR